MGRGCGVRVMPPVATAPVVRPPKQETDPDRTPIWHTISVEEAIAHLATAPFGLSSSEAAQRI
ncbi:MAG: hypothetical protein ACREMQ_21095, partial [Longimicrobiales bacterium]